MKIPFISSTINSITKSHITITITHTNNLNIIHKNINTKEQTNKILSIKHNKSQIITNPITIKPNLTITKTHQLIHNKKISNLPIINNKKLINILTHQNLHFTSNKNQLISNQITHNIITTPHNITLKKTKKLLQQHQIKKLPIIKKNNSLYKLITIQNINKNHNYPNTTKNTQKHLLINTTINTKKNQYKPHQNPNNII